MMSWWRRRKMSETPALMPIEEHLIPWVTERGTIHMPVIRGSYSDTITVSESSDASGPHIWVRSQATATRVASIHLSLERAGHLRDQLTWLIENHYQVKPR